MTNIGRSYLIPSFKKEMSHQSGLCTVHSCFINWNVSTLTKQMCPSEVIVHPLIDSHSVLIPSSQLLFGLNSSKKCYFYFNFFHWSTVWPLGHTHSVLSVLDYGNKSYDIKDTKVHNQYLVLYCRDPGFLDEKLYMLRSSQFILVLVLACSVQYSNPLPTCPRDLCNDSCRVETWINNLLSLSHLSTVFLIVEGGIWAMAGSWYFAG